MANRVNGSQLVNNANRNLPRPDSIPGMEDLTATAPLTRASTAAKSRSDAASPTILSPDGAELVENLNTAEIVKDAESAEVFECAICLQTCVHPVKLPCSHIFCFLCIKGVAIQSKRCALCRQDIPVEFCNDPALLRREDLLKESAFEGGYQWYYQGMNGWWQYDERASKDIEDHYKMGEKSLEMLIAGFLYIVDFENMLQYRRNDPTRRRKVKRDLITIPDRKGVAGLKITSPSTVSPHRLDGDGGENVPCVVQQGAVPATTPTNTRSGNYGNSGTQRSSRRTAAVSPSTPHSTPEDDTSFTSTSMARSGSPDLTNHMAGLSLTTNAAGTAPNNHRTTRSRSSNVRSLSEPQTPEEDCD